MAVKLARSKGGEPKASLSSGSVIAGKYRIERVLGEGGMGTVYAAHHELLDQRVALKVLFEDAIRDKEASARFLQEARSAARLQSEHVARVMDIDTLDGAVPFIVMEYLEGSDLGRQLERRRVFAPSLVADYVIQALDAIAQAHAQGIIHRDIKPSNLFLTTVPDGSQIIKVLDFGISKPTFGRVSTLTSSRSVLGSPPYMSPEQVRSPRTVDARTDIWSVGILLYELLTGKMPFDGEEVGELFAAILEQDPNSIRLLRPDVSEGLERVIVKCLAKNRDHRYADVGELARALAPYGTGAQNKYVEKIASTLIRGEELSNPRRRAVVSGVSPVAQPFDNTTVPDSDEAAADAAPAPELSPTASTVGRRRTIFTLMQGPTRTKIAAFVGGAFAALVATVVIIVMARSGQQTTAAPLPPPAEVTPSPLATATPTALPDPLPDPVATMTTAPMQTAPTTIAKPAIMVPTPRPVPAAKPRVAQPKPPPPPAPKPVFASPTPPPSPPPKPPPQDELKRTFDTWNK